MFLVCFDLFQTDALNMLRSDYEFACIFYDLGGLTGLTLGMDLLRFFFDVTAGFCHKILFYIPIRQSMRFPRFSPRAFFTHGAAQPCQLHRLLTAGSPPTLIFNAFAAWMSQTGCATCPSLHGTARNHRLKPQRRYYSPCLLPTPTQPSPNQ